MVWLRFYKKLRLDRGKRKRDDDVIEEEEEGPVTQELVLFLYNRSNKGAWLLVSTNVMIL